MLSFIKINILHVKNSKKVLFLMALFTINFMLFIFSNNFRSSKSIIHSKKNNLRLITNSQQSSLSLVSTETSTVEVIDLKYILQWSPHCVTQTEGQVMFIEARCEYTNCFITNRRDLLGDYTKFHAILFSGPALISTSNRDLPLLRGTYQKYIFTSIEPSDNYPVCSDRFDGYFNWTWTFRLDSNIKMGHIVVQYLNGTTIGPKPEMHWMKLEDMIPVPQDVRLKLKSKHKFAAWLVSNCNSRYGRENFVKNLNEELKKHGQKYQVDIYGTCGDKKCPPDMFCEDMIEQDYYFYLAFESASNPDYVTEKLLRALEYYTIPVVYGGANYTRFMPDGIYLNANELGVQKLAAKMIEIENDFEQFVEFFKWRNHYTYSSSCSSAESNNFCSFCKMLNNEIEMHKTTVKKNFQEWWDPPNPNCG